MKKSQSKKRAGVVRTASAKSRPKGPAKGSVPESADMGISLSEVLIAFQKSLARAQEHSSSMKSTPDFFLGRRALLDIEGLDIELKVGLAADVSRNDMLTVNFTPPLESASVVRFRVKVKPTEMVGSGVIMVRPPEQSATDGPGLCAMTVVEGRATASRMSFHVAPRYRELPSAEKADAFAAISAELPGGPEDGTITTDDTTGVMTIHGIATDYLGYCKLHPSLRRNHLIIGINGKEYDLKTKPWFKDALIWATVGSASSEILELFPPSNNER